MFLYATPFARVIPALLRDASAQAREPQGPVHWRVGDFDPAAQE